MLCKRKIAIDMMRLLAGRNGELSDGIPVLGSPMRTVLKWQVIVTIGIAAVFGYFADLHGAVSAALGGGVAFLAGLASALVAQVRRPGAPADSLVLALKAEGVKIAMVIVLLGLVFATYQNVVAFALIGTFAVAVVIFSMAFFVREA